MAAARMALVEPTTSAWSRDVRWAFRVGQHGRGRVLGHQLQELGFAERLVHDADARPQQHLAPEFAVQPAAKMAVGAEDDRLVARDLVQDRLGRGRGDDDVAERLHLRRTIDVGERDVVGMLGAEGGEAVGWAAVLQAAAGVHVGQDHSLVRREDLSRLRHEAHTAEGDDLRVGVRCLPAQVQAVADEVREVLQHRRLVIMRQDDGVALALQPDDLVEEVGPGKGDSGLGGHLAVASPLKWTSTVALSKPATLSGNARVCSRASLADDLAICTS